jgi:hypothetical protein
LNGTDVRNEHKKLTGDESMTSNTVTFVNSSIISHKNDRRRSKAERDSPPKQRGSPPP